MSFRNPWIDPRVAQVRVADFQNYLEKRGWRPIPESPRGFLSFEIPGDSESLIRIPAPEDGPDYVRFVIEVISDMARIEDKYAVEILNDILTPSSTPAPPSCNGKVHESTLVSADV